EVLSQIWATLYDYPSLKTCEGLKHYVKDCVRLAWSLSNQYPPFVIEYEGRVFRKDLHVRFHSSNQESDHIKTYLWPTLLEGRNGPCVHKGVVIT
ncbi:MIEAP domain-containing protein, partial [Nephila pilipes]